VIKTHKAIFAAAIALTLGLSPNANAWHGQGHMMTAKVAWDQMTPGARCRAVALLRPHEADYGDQLTAIGPDRADEALFVSAATWPDRIKQNKLYTDDGETPTGAHAGDNVGFSDSYMHKYWHFADNPVPADPKANLPPPINAGERIALFAKTLASNAPDDLKGYDLVWLIHLVGDVHQPLHAASQVDPTFKGGKDDGGNAVALKWKPKTAWRDATNYPAGKYLPNNLHSYWDGAPGDDSSALADAADRVASLPAADPGKIMVINVQAWLDESHDLAGHYAYARPIKRDQKGPFYLTPAYAKRAVATTRDQVALGGARLARLLNQTLTYSQPGCQ
jgi:hypothetical protein